MSRVVKYVELGGRRIGPGEACFIIAEAGVNHNGELGRALELVDAAAEAKADAVKFQTFSAERLASPAAPKAEYQRRGTDAEESQYDMLRSLELSADDHRSLWERCRKRGIMFLSSPFDEAAADFLDELGVPGFKIPSGELTNLPFLRYVAAKMKPMIVSTGMADLDEVGAALAAVNQTGNDQLVLLHCVSAYPADPAEANLRAMAALAERFGAPVGFSDHTLGLEVALAAAALGATVIEKHFTLDRGLPGPDHAASLEPDELARLVAGVRTVEAALGHGRKEPTASEAETAAVARKSLVAAADIPAGATITTEMLIAKRPGAGIPPAKIGEVVGRRARQDIPAGTLVAWGMLA